MKRRRGDFVPPRQQVQDVPVWGDFEDLASDLHNSVLDLSYPMADLINVWSRILALRSHWIQLDAEGRVEWPSISPPTKGGKGVNGGRAWTQQSGLRRDAWSQPAQPAGAGPAWSEHGATDQFGGPQRGAEVQANPIDNWKGKLQQAYSKQLGAKAIQKDEISYTIERVGTRFQATVQAPGLSEPFTGDVCSSKKLAEHAAARAAICSDFPQFADAGVSAKPAEPQQNARMKLNEMLSLLLGRQSTKEDTHYEIVPERTGKGQTFVCNLRLVPCTLL